MHKKLLRILYASSVIWSACVQSGNFRAIIFDCDGVLVDNGNGYFLDWQHALRSQNFELLPDVFWNFMHKKELVGLPTADGAILDFCCELLGYDCRESLQAHKDVFSKELHQKGFPPIVKTIEFVQKLNKDKEDHHCKLAVASASSRTNILNHLRKFGIEHCFDLIVSGCEDLAHYNDPEGVNKPKPYIYEYTAQQLSVKPSECIVIEDSKTGITAAVSAGCFTVAIPTEATCKQDLSLANLILRSLADMNSEIFLKMIDTNTQCIEQ